MTDLHRFTPPALAELASPPVFLLRDGDRRARRDFRKMLLTEGLTTYAPDAVRAEARAGLRALWEPADAEQHIGRIEAYWHAADQANAAAGHDEEAEPAIDPAERRLVEDLLSRLGQSWAPLRRMASANAMYAAEAPSVVLSTVLRGWESIDLRYCREDGVVSLDTLEGLENALGDVERAQGGKPGLAYAQLCEAALERLFPATAADVERPSSAGLASEPEAEPA